MGILFCRALNYGGIGWVIGHEITHGFDDEGMEVVEKRPNVSINLAGVAVIFDKFYHPGRQKDGDGKLVNWWDDATLERFMERASCFVSQYNHYFISEVNVSVSVPRESSLVAYVEK